jgi:tetratricopeptide (TPR) repeat protein
MSVKRTLPVSLCLLIALSAAANDELFEQAAEAARQGDLVMMQQTYERIIAVDSDNVRAWNGKATAQAWRGNYFAAIESYRETLAIEPDNPAALVGIGYAFAWAGDYQYARRSFEHALASSPENFEAQKGIAYVSLWSGDADLARSQFAELQQSNPADAELSVGLGQALLAAGDSRAAQSAFDTALQLDPGRADASSGRMAALNGAPKFDASAWYGSTSNADSGLRLVELGWQAGRDTRLFARYDDSLSLDNPEISRRGETARTYLAGVQHRINSNFAALFEAGVRQLPDGDQQLYRAELALDNLPGRVALGTQLGKHELGYDDNLLYLGIGIPVGERWQIESNNYFSTVGVNEDEEWRSVLNFSYATDNGWNAMVGGGVGEVDRSGQQNSERVNVVHAMVSMPVFGYHRLHFVLRNEDVEGDSFNTAMIGFTYRLPR